MTENEMIKLGSTCGNINAYDPRTSAPSGYEIVPMRSISSADTGYQATTYYNSSEKQYLYCISGTNDIDDRRGWNSLLSGYSGNSAQYSLALGHMNGLNEEAKLNNDKVFTAGHSLAGAFTDLGTYTFGWSSAKFDAAGGYNVINSEGYQSRISELGITPVGGGLSISINVGGWGPFGNPPKLSQSACDQQCF